MPRRRAARNPQHRCAAPPDHRGLPAHQPAHGSATIRRANAIDDWIEAGIEGRDIWDARARPARHEHQLGDRLAAPRARLPDPRPLEIAPARDKRTRFSETALQMCINQRVYQTAIARTNALAERLKGLRGGDVDDAGLTGRELRQDLSILAASPPATAPTSSITEIDPPKRAGCGSVRFSPGQAAINRRIAIASIVRVNLLVDNLASSLSGTQFQGGSLSGADLGPGALA